LAAAHQGISVECIVLDYQMPGMTGGEMARIVRATPEVADTPIVLLTSVDQSLNGSSYRELSIEAQLIKPARSSLLLETIVAAIQKRRATHDDVVWDIVPKGTATPHSAEWTRDRAAFGHGHIPVH
jgi:CheY-like chemotaxis protein